jgi:hypothetical protein
MYEDEDSSLELNVLILDDEERGVLDGADRITQLQ